MLLAITLITCGCTEPRIAIRSLNLTPQELELAQSAADEWCEASGKCAVILELGHGDNTIETVDVIDPLDPGVIGLCKDDYRHTLLYPVEKYSKYANLFQQCFSTAELVFKNMVLHELGHFLRGQPYLEDDNVYEHLPAGNVMSIAINTIPEDCKLTLDDVRYVE